MPKLSRPKLLIVDDEASMVKVLSLALKSSNVDILTAFGGDEGIKATLEHQPEIIITDLMMPQVSGFDLITQVMEKLPQTLILVLTAFTSSENAIHALKLGAFDYLLKPISPAAVRQAVQRAAARITTQTIENWRQIITLALNTGEAHNAIPRKIPHLFGTAIGATGGILFHPTMPVLENTFWADGKTQIAPLSAWAKRLFFAPDTPDFAIDRTTIAGKPVSVLGIRVPMTGKRQPVLVLSHPSPDYFDDTDQLFVETLIPIAALALENSLAHQRIHASNRQLSTLQSLNTLTYNISLSLNRALRLAAENIRQHMGYGAVMIFLHNSRLNGLVAHSAAGIFDKFLKRHGDSPARRIMFPVGGKSPIAQTFATRTPQSFSAEAWIPAWEEIGATDIATAFTEHQLARIFTIPLWLNDNLTGILVIGSTKNSLPPEEHALFTTISNQISLLIHNANIHLREQQRHREMEALYHAGLMITSSLSSNDVLDAIIGELIDLTEIERCRISRWDGHTFDVVIERDLERTRAGWTAHTRPGNRVSLKNQSVVQSVLETQRLKLVTPKTPSLSEDERRRMVAHRITARLVIPLVIRGKSIGVIELMTTRKRATWGGPIVRLAQGLAAQAAIALENARLHALEVQRLEQEMELAHRIQVSLLPTTPPTLAHLSIAARSVSAKEVGGDFYRYFSLLDGKFGIAIGDVSGKGIPAALFMAITTTALNNVTQQYHQPAEILTALNHTLHTQMRVNGINTGLLIAIFENDCRTVTIANAGMIAPMVRTTEGAHWVDVAGIPIGALAEATYTAKTITLPPAASLVLCSDGLIEAHSPQRELFGFERWENTIAALPPDASSNEALESVWDTTAKFMRGADPHDDMTLITIKTKPKK